jgi:ABC-type sugar transport system ATPase subunit
LLVPDDRGDKAVDRGEVILGLRPEDVTVAEDGIGGEVYVVEPLGRDDLVDVHIAGKSVRVLVDPALKLRIGDSVSLAYNRDKVQFFDPETEQSLLWQ